jgi:hypothetical protein
LGLDEGTATNEECWSRTGLVGYEQVEGTGVRGGWRYPARGMGGEVLGRTGRVRCAQVTSTPVIWAVSGGAYGVFALWDEEDVNTRMAARRQSSPGVSDAMRSARFVGRRPPGRG